MAQGLKSSFFWGIGTGMLLAVLAAGAGSYKWGFAWAFAVGIGALLALVHLGLVALGIPGASKNALVTVMSLLRLLLIGFLIFTALHNGVWPAPLVIGLVSVYMGLLGGLLIGHAKTR